MIVIYRIVLGEYKWLGVVIDTKLRVYYLYNDLVGYSHTRTVCDRKNIINIEINSKSIIA